MMNWIDHCLGFQGGGIMMIGMFIFWGLLIFIGMYFLKSFLNGKNIKNGQHFDILKERFASGDLTEEEYDRLRKKLY